MKLTEQHLSDYNLQRLIEWYSIFPSSDDCEFGLLEALLELKQRRSEDSQREAGKLCKCHPHDLVYYGCRCGANINSEAKNIA